MALELPKQNTCFVLMLCKHNAFWERHEFCQIGDIASPTDVSFGMFFIIMSVS